MGCRSIVSMCLVSLVGSEHVLPVRHKISRPFILERVLMCLSWQVLRVKYSVGDAHPQDGASSDIATHISSVAEKVEWLDEQLRMFFRAADVIAVEVSDDVKSATTFVSSGVSHVNGNAIHNSIVVTEPMSEPSKAEVHVIVTEPIRKIALEAEIHGLKTATVSMRERLSKALARDVDV